MKNTGDPNDKYEDNKNDIYKEKIIVKNNKDPPPDDFIPINCDYSKPSNSNEEEYVRRPMNAFMVWSRSERRKLALKFPNMLNCEISKLLGAEWAKMTENEKKPYILESKKLRTIHSQKYPEYSYRPRRKKRKNESNSANNQSSLQVTNNGISCYPLATSEIYDSGFSNGNYNSYAYYYDQFSNPSYMQSIDPQNTSCSNSNFMSTPYNRVDTKIPNYYTQFPATNQYTNAYMDSYKILAPYSTADATNALNCASYYPNYPYIQSAMLSNESVDKSTNTGNCRNYGAIYSDVNNITTEPTSNDVTLVNPNVNQQQPLFLPTSNAESSPNQHNKGNEF